MWSNWKSGSAVYDKMALIIAVWRSHVTACQGDRKITFCNCGGHLASLDLRWSQIRSTLMQEIADSYPNVNILNFIVTKTKGFHCAKNWRRSRSVYCLPVWKFLCIFQHSWMNDELRGNLFLLSHYRKVIKLQGIQGVKEFEKNKTLLKRRNTKKQ